MLPALLRSAVTTRLRILAHLDISETRRPQDGRIRLPIGRRTIDMRVSTMPTVHNENVVLRLLEKSQVVKGLEALGMGSADLEAFRSSCCSTPCAA